MIYPTYFTDKGLAALKGMRDDAVAMYPQSKAAQVFSIAVSHIEAITSENLRLLDMVRHQRAELHEVGLISDAEYADLLNDDDSVARLANYDEMREEIAHLRRELADLQEGGLGQ